MADTKLHAGTVEFKVEPYGPPTPYSEALSEKYDHLYSSTITSWRDFARRYLLSYGPAIERNCGRPVLSTGFLYFVQAGDAIKIGCTQNPKKRFAQMQTGCPKKIVVLCALEGSAWLERFYHRKFAAHRLHGEWFDPHPDILAEIERLRTPSEELE